MREGAAEGGSERAVERPSRGSKRRATLWVSRIGWSMPPCQPPRHAVLNLVLPCWGVGVYEVGGYEQEGTDHTLLLHYREKKNEDLLLLLLFTHHITHTHKHTQVRAAGARQQRARRKAAAALSQEAARARALRRQRRNIRALLRRSGAAGGRLLYPLTYPAGHWNPWASRGRLR